MKLIYVPRTRSNRPRWLLEELGVPYELKKIDAAGTKTPEHLALHPLAHVPVLQDGDLTLFESAAIVLHIADKFPEKKLIPPLGSKERALVYQWLFFAMTEVEAGCIPVFREKQKPEAERDAKVIEAGFKRLDAAGAAVEKALGEHDFIVGNQFGVADIVLGSALNWGKRMGALANLPRLEAWLKRITERPAFKRANAD